MNELIFFFHTLTVILCGLAFLKLGKEALISFICLQGILSNLLVTKQISLFGFHVTSSDVFAVGVLISLNMLQEYYGHQVTKRAIWISFSMLMFYLIMTQIHLWYAPNIFDTMHFYFTELFSMMPRLAISSVFVYIIVQHLDATLFGLLKKLCHNHFFTLRSIISLTLSQFLDTILFTLFALYGVVENIVHVILFSFAVKLMVILLAVPLIALTKKIIPPHNQQ